MLVRHAKGGVVLLPSQGHRAELTAGGTTLVLNGHQINLARPDGTVIWGEAPAYPDPEPYLMDMSAAFGCPARLRSGMIASAPVPAGLHARVILAGSRARFVALPTRRYPAARDVVWTVTREDGSAHEQKLTDCMTFEMPLVSDLLLLVSRLNGRPAWRIPIPAGTDYAISITNDDDPPRPSPTPNPEATLVEYDFLYGLMRSKCGTPSAPVGDYRGDPGANPPKPERPETAVAVPRLWGAGDPLCAGGQGDPPDPPEDPPPPDPVP